MTPHGTKKIWAALVIASFGWGTAAIATRSAFGQGAEPLTVAAMRTVLGCAAVLAYLLISRRRFPPPAAWRLGLVLGTLNMAIPYACFTLAVQHISAGFVGLVISTVPIATAAFAHVMLPDEPLHRGKLVGLAVSFVGVAILLMSGDSGLGDEGNPLLGTALTLVAVATSAFAAAFARRHAPHFTALDLAGTQFGVAAVILITLMIGIEGSPFGMSAGGWALMGYLGIVSTFTPFVLFFWLLQRVSATEVSLAGYLVPVIALIGGVLLLGEVVTLAIGGGGALVLIGVILTERSEGIRRGGAAGVR